MALFHQIKRTGENDLIAKRQEKAFADRAKVDVDGKALQRALETRGRKPDPNAKKLLTLRLDPDVIDYFKAGGEGWQTRMNEALRKVAGL